MVIPQKASFNRKHVIVVMSNSISIYIHYCPNVYKKVRKYILSI